MTIDETSRNGFHDSASHTAPNGAGSEQDILKEGVSHARAGARRAYKVASEETQKLGDFVREQAGVIVERQKNGLARGVSEVARHIRSSSEALSEQPNIEDVVTRAADQVDAAASALERKTNAELLSDAENICRRYPVTVAACAVVLGALVSRSLKSTRGSQPAAR